MKHPARNVALGIGTLATGGIVAGGIVAGGVAATAGASSTITCHITRQGLTVIGATDRLAAQLWDNCSATTMTHQTLTVELYNQTTGVYLGGSTEVTHRVSGYVAYVWPGSIFPLTPDIYVAYGTITNANGSASSVTRWRIATG